MKYLITKITLLSLLCTNLFAHPHTFIEVEPTAEIKNKKIDKLHIKWILDEMTSMMLIMELDINGDGKFDKGEKEFIYENYFLSLEKYNYYMKVSSKDKILHIKPKNFNASIKDNKLIYSFDIEEKIDTSNLEITFYDETLFVGMMLEKEYITLKGINKDKKEHFKTTVFGVK